MPLLPPRYGFRTVLKTGGVYLKLISVGFGNTVSADRIIAIVTPDSSPIRRIIQEAKDGGSLIDASCGRRTRAVIIADSGHIILSALQSETISHRVASKGGFSDEEEER
ncbi:MAG: DUF370 domain-containing protein [Clostridiales bacterium]|jgi:regulator of extracellular matrix RemA (YlzA/DUF370 family)|nr:DUF370 domain-containing protein [Clostridiales bacterium]